MHTFLSICFAALNPCAPIFHSICLSSKVHSSLYVPICFLLSIFVYTYFFHFLCLYWYLFLLFFYLCMYLCFLFSIFVLVPVFSIFYLYIGTCFYYFLSLNVNVFFNLLYLGPSQYPRAIRSYFYSSILRTHS